MKMPDTATLNKRMCISHCLDQHPILQYPIDFKIDYLKILQYFCEGYCTDDKFTFAMFENYKKKILGDAHYTYQYDKARFKNSLRYSAENNHSKYKFFTCRFSLLIDCLFLCCFSDENKGKLILNELKRLYSNPYHKKLEELFHYLYHGGTPIKAIGKAENLVHCWLKNQTYYQELSDRVVITANMSAGKSTLINAIIGKKVTQSKNDVCTAKIHYINNKTFDDGFAYKYDYEMNLDADVFTLMNDMNHNDSQEVVIGTYFRFTGGINKKVCFVDTPGVNSSMDPIHRKTTKTALLTRDYDKLIYVINAENIGTEDDRQHMKYIAEIAKDKNVIFVLNKVDRFRKGEDDVFESINKIQDEVIKFGFINPQIYPVSAYAGLLGKKQLWHEKLDEDEIDELYLLSRKFNGKNYDLSQYYSKENQQCVRSIINAEQDETRKKQLNFLNNTGILALENIILS